LISWTPIPHTKRPDKRADFIVTLVCGTLVLVDPTLSSAYNMSYCNIDKPRYLATHAELAKWIDYRRFYIIPKGAFYPTAVEAGGAWGPTSYRLLRGQFDLIKKTTTVDKYMWTNVKEAVAFSICKSNTVMLDLVRYGATKPRVHKPTTKPISIAPTPYKSLLRSASLPIPNISPSKMQRVSSIPPGATHQ
jgi:hypothetical protein